MNLKKILPTILCAALLLATLAGCSDSTQYGYENGGPPAEEQPDTNGEPPDVSRFPGATGSHEQPGGISLDSMFATFPPDTVMIRAGDFTVTWAELFFSIRGTTESMVAAFGGLPDLSMVLPDGSTYADALLEYSVENALLFRAIEFGAKETGVSLSEEDLELLRFDFESMLEVFGSEEELRVALWEHDSVYSLDLFNYLIATDFLASLLFDHLYGVRGSLLQDEDLADLTAFDGYLMAQHILRLKTEDGSEEPLQEIEAILEMLEGYSGDDFGSFFQTLMFEHSEDGGLMSFPQGYLFQIGDMVPEFYDATISIGIGEISGIVETVYGYHIVYRLPIDYDGIPSSRTRTNDFRSLRHITATDMFDFDLYGWMLMLPKEFTPEFESIDLAELFRS
jgi:hypothetical protein